LDRFETIDGVAAVIPGTNVSTDAIIPSVWAIKPGVDLGEKLFANLRYDAEGRERDDFVLNVLPFRKSKILIAGANFGCGSSRESAVWAIKRFGILCVIAPSFGEIFRENMFKNGMLPIELTGREIENLIELLSKSNSKRMNVNLETRSIMVDEFVAHFEISIARRIALLDGLEDFDIVQQAIRRIAEYERQDKISRPWN
jgi:3-isopropylmalate/(R)-2-methylmalate dehydratase small subunit